MQGLVVLGPQVTFPLRAGQREKELHIPAGSEKKVGLGKSGLADWYLFAPEYPSAQPQ